MFILTTKLHIIYNTNKQNSDKAWEKVDVEEKTHRSSNTTVKE